MSARRSHHGVRLDHQDASSVEQGFADALALAGKIDVLVNNGNEAQDKEWTNITADQFTRQLANATGYFLLAPSDAESCGRARAPGEHRDARIDVRPGWLLPGCL